MNIYPFVPAQVGTQVHELRVDILLWVPAFAGTTERVSGGASSVASVL